MMSITPQMIKDQEFQVKFRGYDTVEVNAYLDLIAEEFFELQERCRLQVEDLQAFHEVTEDLEQQKISLEAGSAEARKMAEELRQSGLRMEQRIGAFAKEAEGLQAWITRLEEEKKGQAEALTSAEARLLKAEETILQEMIEKEALARKVELMEEQQRVAKKDEVDFRSTLVAAQNFCDSMKEKSREEAEQLLDATRAEIEELRRTAMAELSRLPGEIETLQQKREEARKVLRATLEAYLHNLDLFPADEDAQNRGWESDDLFQKIQILEDGTLAPEDLVALNMEAGALSHPDGEELLAVFGGDEPSGDHEDEERG